MSRLIDADNLEEAIKEYFKKRITDNSCMVDGVDCSADICRFVKEQTTAFDVEKAIGQIEAIKEKGACFDEQCKQCKYLSHCWDGEESDSLAFDKAIEIVKRGGRDAQNQ